MRKRDCSHCGTKAWRQLKNLPSRQYPRTWAKAEFLDRLRSGDYRFESFVVDEHQISSLANRRWTRKLLQDYRYQGGSAAGQTGTPLLQWLKVATKAMKAKR